MALPATAQERKPVVLELFTTQSCNACPPADALLKELAAEDPAVIAIGCHVSYMDTPAWKDTFAQPFCESRHSGYFRTLGLQQFGTPTMIINGQYDVIDGKEDLTRAAIKMVRSLPALPEIQIQKTDDAIDIILPDVPMTQSAEIWLFGLDSMKTVTIGGGQNAKVTVDYINPVTHLEKLMDWDGKHQKISYPLDKMPAAGFAVIAQNGYSGPIVAAGKLTD